MNFVVFRANQCHGEGGRCTRIGGRCFLNFSFGLVFVVFGECGRARIVVHGRLFYDAAYLYGCTKGPRGKKGFTPRMKLRRYLYVEGVRSVDLLRSGGWVQSEVM